jgi:hypothetical protein
MTPKEAAEANIKRDEPLNPEYEPDSDTGNTTWEMMNVEQIRSGHPLLQILKKDNPKAWNNIAPPLAKLLDTIVEHMIDRDIYRNKWKKRLRKRNT